MCKSVGGRLVKLELSREEVFCATRVRHSEKIFLKSWVRPNGRLVARSYKAYSNQGAYGSHGHGIAAKGTNAFRQLYNDEKARKTEIFTVYTNTAAAGAMRGYGTPQAVFAIESHIEDIARNMKLDPLELRFLNVMPVGFVDNFTKNVNRFDSFRQCVEAGRAKIGWEEKRKRYAQQSGPIRRGVGMSLFWYNTAVWPISIEVSSCRMVLNQDGSVQIQLAETEIGQGADTVFAQMASQTLGIPWQKVHVISTQDTDITPFGLSAYGSRQTYVGGAAVHKVAGMLKEKILRYAEKYTHKPAGDLDIVDGNIVLAAQKSEKLASLEELATDTLYHVEHAEHLTAEATAQVKSNALSLGCAFAEVEVDIPLGKVTLLEMVNCHDCGTLINPQLVDEQIRGGIVQGIGAALFEHCLYDEAGQLLNGSMMDYLVPMAGEMPDIEVGHVVTPTGDSELGAKGAGEAGTAGAPACMMNALNDALRPLGSAPITTMPFTPERVRNALRH
jgi:xanthine dehydrogenase molybdenum-binding subunit